MANVAATGGSVALRHDLSGLGVHRTAAHSPTTFVQSPAISAPWCVLTAGCGGLYQSPARQLFYPSAAFEGRNAEFMASAFQDAKRDCFTSPAGRSLTHHARNIESRERRTYARVPRVKGGLSQLPVARPVRSTDRATPREAIHHAQPRTCDDDGVEGENGDGRGATDLRETLAGREVPACLDQRALRLTAVPMSKPPEGHDGGYLGLPQLQPDKVVQHTAQIQSEYRIRLRVAHFSPYRK
jgi:hypothetical protein